VGGEFVGPDICSGKPQSIQNARLSFQSSELPQGSVAPSPFGSMGGDTLVCGEGGGEGPNSDEETNTLVLYV
jgi:hypothetical protein